MSGLEEARAQLSAGVRSARALHDFLLELLASLPAAPAGDADTGDEPVSPLAELRTALECALHDYLKPLIEVLTRALRTKSEEPE